MHATQPLQCTPSGLTAVGNKGDVSYLQAIGEVDTSAAPSCGMRRNREWGWVGCNPLFIDLGECGFEPVDGDPVMSSVKV